MSHEFVFLGVRVDRESRPVAYHEWCIRCGVVRSTRMADGDIVFLVPGPLHEGRDVEHCVLAVSVPQATA